MCLEAYAAGVIDGDGSIQIGTVGSTNFRLVVYLSGCNIAPLDALKERWRGSISVSATPSGRSYYRWCIVGPTAMAFLGDILPHLKGKVNQALLGLRFQESARHEMRDREMQSMMSTLSRRGR